MLTIEIPEQELYNEATGDFMNITKKVVLQLEHSLISLSKWESRWKRPFLEEKEMSRAELVDYVRCMTINQNIDSVVYLALTAGDLEKVQKYVADPYSATTIYDTRNQQGGPKQIITSELIYWQMIYFGIPFECEKWHLNRLLTLIRICGIKGTNNQMSQMDLFAQNKMLHQARKAGRGK